MKRRDFSKQLVGTGLGLTLASRARAQGTPEEGKQYMKLQPAVPTNLPAGKKIEVIEFFWYGCPHCFTFEPVLGAWARQLPADVYYHPLPIYFLGPVEHQKLFYALEEIGQREALQAKIFTAIHVQHKSLNTEAEIGAFVSSNGVDGAKFAEAFKSFAVNTKVTRGKQVASAYKLDGVPALSVQGRFHTSPALASGGERAVQVADFLIQRVRSGA
jgi:thiol:disulfide interchange protein DsbA